jgi:dGTPase
LIASLRPYASNPVLGLGRRFPQPDAPTRSAFQRDKDRVIHSSAFRRLVYKTQVFVNHEGDLFRTRLTHSLEVAQLGRSIARTLGLSEDLVEAIALAHDLGHTPFGHAGQDSLNVVMKAFGGFEHNLQSLRVVDVLETRYPEFNGLNLSFETREGILKHCSRVDARALCASEPDGPAARFLTGTQPTLEAQLCNVADEIAYNAHDLDDGVRSGLLELDQVATVPLVQLFFSEVSKAYPLLRSKEPRRFLYECIRRMLSEQVYDVIAASTQSIQLAGVESMDDVRQQRTSLIGFSSDMKHASSELKRFLFQALYRHTQVKSMTRKAGRVVDYLFAHYMAHPDELPCNPAWLPVYAEHSDQPNVDPVYLRARRVADYVAGMTDRFAVGTYERLSGAAAW